MPEFTQIGDGMPGDIYDWSIGGLESHAKHWDCDPGDNGEMLNKVGTHSVMLLTGSPWPLHKRNWGREAGRESFPSMCYIFVQRCLAFFVNKQPTWKWTIK